MAKDDKWQLYVVRGFGKDRFDPAQIEAGLALGLQPQLHLAPLAKDSEIFRDLVAYMSQHPEISFDVVDAKGEFYGDAETLENSLETITTINDMVGPRITHAIFKAGAVRTHEEAHELQAKKGYSSLIATFSHEEYAVAFAKAKEKIEECKKYAGGKGIELLVENVYYANYDMAKSLDEKPPMQKQADKRWGKTPWLPHTIQLGDLGCVQDLDELGLGICLDIEHLEGSIEYSNMYSTATIDSDLLVISESEKKFMKDFGTLIQRGEPLITNHHGLDRTRFVLDLKAEIPAAHLGGQVRMVYYDIYRGVRVPVIGSHMPITGPEDENEFIRNPYLASEMAVKRMETLKEYLSALHAKGTRKAVLEHHVGEYTGPAWDKYTKVSRDNVVKTLQEIGAQIQ